MDLNTATSSCGEAHRPGSTLADYGFEVCEIWQGCASLLSSLPEVCTKWQVIGFEMGFEQERLDGIEKEYGNGTTDCFRVMLMEWWNHDDVCGRDSCCSPKLRLIEALSKPHVGLMHIACQIKKEICGCTGAHMDPEHSLASTFSCRDEMMDKGGASAHQMNNPWGSSNLSTSAQGLHVPDESRVKDFRTESDLAEQTRHFELEFFKVFHMTFSSLKETEVPMHDICFCLAHFEGTNRFMRAKNLDDFVVVLGSCISWFNYSLLEMIIGKFATEEVQQAMRHYISGLKGSLEERKVLELPPDIYKNASGKRSNPSIVENNKKKLGVKIDYVWEKFLVKDIQTMRERIASILGIEERSLFLLSVTEGCVYLEFLVPEFASEEILSLEITPDMHSEFERARVIEVVCSTVLVYTNKIQYHVETTEWLFNELVEVT